MVFSSLLFPVAIFLQFSDRLMGLLLASTLILTSHVKKGRMLGE